jgi:hypothetical protein
MRPWLLASYPREGRGGYAAAAVVLKKRKLEGGGEGRETYEGGIRRGKAESGRLANSFLFSGS